MTPKQQRFVQEFCKDGNATRAAIAAGYSEKTAYQTGYENLRKPEIAKAIAEFQEESAERAQITVESVSSMLEQAYKVAEGQEASAAMVQAAMGLGKLHGLITDKIKAEVKNTYEDDLAKIYQAEYGKPNGSAETAH